MGEKNGKWKEYSGLILTVVLSLAAMLFFGFDSFSVDRLFGLVVICGFIASAIVSLFYLEFTGFFLSLGTLLYCYDAAIALTGTPLWVFLICALVLGAVSNRLFFRIRYARFFPKGSSKSNGEYERHDAAVVCKNAFHSVTKQVTSRSLETAYISSSFSSLNVRFDEAALSPDGADVAVMGFFGKVQLFVPEGWRVLDNEARKAEKKRKKDFDDDAPSVPTLRIFENVVFAGVFIRTIEGKKPIKIYIIRENQEFAEDQEVALFLDGQKCTNVKNDETVFVETQSGVHAIAFEFGGKRTDMNVDLRENSAVRITLNRESGEVAARVLSLEGIRS